MQADTEQKLVEQAKTDADAFGELYDLHYAKIFNYILRRTANVMVAEDITTEVFMKALDKIHTFTWQIDESRSLLNNSSVVSDWAILKTMHDNDIHKASGIIIVDRKVLVERSVGKEYFIHPGGKIEPGETPKQAVIRELQEEFKITVREEDLEVFDKNSAPAANSPEVNVHMDVFLVKKWEGEIMPASEVEEIRWITSDIPTDIQIGSIMQHETIPKLKAKGLID